MTKSRLEAFSDGVIAIIITIMVLELKAPHGETPDVIAPLLPDFLSYVLSFVNVGIYWNNHHHMLHSARKIDGPVLWANLHLLFWLSLFPITTAWMGENHFAMWPVAAYGAVSLMAGTAYYILARALVRCHGAASEFALALGGDFKGRISLAIYAAAIGLSFVSPWIGLACYVGVAGIWFIPDRRFERASSRRSPNRRAHRLQIRVRQFVLRRGTRPTRSRPIHGPPADRWRRPAPTARIRPSPFHAFAAVRASAARAPPPHRAPASPNTGAGLPDVRAGSTTRTDVGCTTLPTLRIPPGVAWRTYPPACCASRRAPAWCRTRALSESNARWQPDRPPNGAPHDGHGAGAMGVSCSTFTSRCYRVAAGKRQTGHGAVAGVINGERGTGIERRSAAREPGRRGAGQADRQSRP